LWGCMWSCMWGLNVVLRVLKGWHAQRCPRRDTTPLWRMPWLGHRLCQQHANVLATLLIFLVKGSDFNWPISNCLAQDTRVGDVPHSCVTWGSATQEPREQCGHPTEARARRERLRRYEQLSSHSLKHLLDAAHRQCACLSCHAVTSAPRGEEFATLTCAQEGGGLDQGRG